MKESGHVKIRILYGGPYEVSGEIPLNQVIIGTDGRGESRQWQDGRKYPPRDEDYHLCRCGHSKDRPYCDGTHKDRGFTGQEVADKLPYEIQAKSYSGKTLNLMDQENLCAGARFCDPDGSVWVLAVRSGDPENERMAIQEACDCPSGRLTVTHKDGTVIEPELPREIGVVEDVYMDNRGPLWVKGGILLEGADGEPYEARNRVTLCRCGESRNLPFCDASHYQCDHMKGVDP